MAFINPSRIAALYKNYPSCSYLPILEDFSLIHFFFHASATGRQSALIVKGLSLTSPPQWGQRITTPSADGAVSDHDRQCGQPK
jgi:hypothetical protein